MSRSVQWIAASFAALAALACLEPAPARAQAGPSLAGRNVQMLIGFGAGGGYDLWGRVVARHIGQHLPGNPTVVPQNMPGAGSFVAANNIYNLAPKDGSVMGIIARDAALGPITGAVGARFDPTRITWLGTPTTETNVCIANSTAKVKTLKDLYDKELIVGDTGVGTGTHSYPKALNALLGMKFKIIAGFPSSSDVFLAMERGEVDGICESLDSVSGKRPDWIPSKKVTILFQGGAAPNPELKDVPFVADLARNPRRPAGDRVSLCGPRHRPPVRGPARPAGGPPEDGARCLHGHHEGPGIPRGCQAQHARCGAGGRRASRRTDQEDLRHPQADRGQDRGADQIAANAPGAAPRPFLKV